MGALELHRAANLWHASRSLPAGQFRLYKVAWIASCILYDRQKLLEVGGFSFWTRLPRYHSGEEVLVQNLLMRLWGGCGIMPSGTYYSQVPSTVLNPRGAVDGHALALLPEMVERYVSQQAARPLWRARAKAAAMMTPLPPACSTACPTPCEGGTRARLAHRRLHLRHAGHPGLAQALPGAEFIFIGLPFLRDLVARSPHLARFVEFPGYPGMADQFFEPRRALSFFAAMQAEQFDLALQMNGSGVYSNPFTLMLVRPPRPALSAPATRPDGWMRPCHCRIQGTRFSAC